ncbi:hypothetical protein [Rhizobium mesosinicum]|uniref:DUF4239 domain-containing protein n=1 Tax=Rhizobium mesosinicum TaxID=335017 RepID=A0ABS7GUX9_9HYPH|nr:hypothetical protein [Rhizobium mesosinicum]MBW9053170.1 hypothetical protein [Rhizobium mesosinicum]
MASVLIGIAIIGGTTATVLAAYYFMYLLMGGDPGGRDRELASSVITRIASLHALILALVFAQEMIEYQALRTESAVESNAVGDVFYDAERFGPQAQAPIQKALKDYVRIVIEQEWNELGRTGELSAAAWDQWNIAYLKILELAPVNAKQESLRSHMLDEIHTVSESRDRRENSGTDSISLIFWFAAVSGVIFTAIGYYPYAPDARNLLLLSIFGIFTGIILFFIYAFSNPYSPPATLFPTAFERLQEEISGPDP